MRLAVINQRLASSSPRVPSTCIRPAAAGSGPARATTGGTSSPPGPRRPTWALRCRSWYLKDPAGNFSEYYSDMDCIIDDQLWTPEDLEGARGLFSWGPPPPPSFLHPEDLAAMMTGAHSAR